MRLRIARPLVGLVAVAMVTACGGTSTDDGGDSGEAASNYPEDSIRWVVPYPPGGGTDTTSRIMATCLEEELGTTIVVENVTGASGARGVQELVAAEPDGYTLGLAITTAMTITPLVEDVGYTKDDITPIGSFFDFGLIIGVNKDSPYQTAEDFLAAVEANPGEITVAVPGTTSPKAIVFQALAQEYGLEFNIVPFEGSAAVNNALLGGQVDAAGLDADLVTTPFVESGDFTPLFSGSSEPWVLRPDLPSLEDLGYGDATTPVIEYLLAGPAGLPDDVVGTLEPALQACVESPEIIDQLGEGYVPDPFRGQEGALESLDENQEFYEGILGQ